MEAGLLLALPASASNDRCCLPAVPGPAGLSCFGLLHCDGSSYLKSTAALSGCSKECLGWLVLIAALAHHWGCQTCQDTHESAAMHAGLVLLDQPGMLDLWRPQLHHLQTVLSVSWSAMALRAWLIAWGWCSMEKLAEKPGQQLPGQPDPQALPAELAGHFDQAGIWEALLLQDARHCWVHCHQVSLAGPLNCSHEALAEAE